jgi:hypothetical protein
MGIGTLLGNAQRLLESLWAILIGYWKAAGKCQIKTEPTRKMLLLAGCDEKSGKEAIRQ